jgi:enterobactin synthetase component D / holo-[acyl-carrier protein] synthase
VWPARRQTVAVFDGLLPPGVCWAVGPQRAGLDDLFPQEAAAIAGAVPARLAEFAAGRVAARDAMAALGIGPVAIPVGERRVPQWPPGVVGSITHCAGLVAAAVGWSDDVVAIGIDAEPAAALDDDLLEVVATPVERAVLHEPLAGVVVFSAKESFYKCWSALDGPVLEFHDVEVSFAGSSYSALPAGGEPWPGRWAVRGGFVLTAAWREAAGTAGPRRATQSTRSGSSAAP